MTHTNKIEAAKAKAAEALAREIARIEWGEALRAIAPDGICIESTAHHDYCDVDSIRYEARSAVDVAAIITEWRDKYGAFLPVGKYTNGCCVITAYPHGEYLDPEALKAIEDDAVEARNSKGRGFSFIEFSFYPTVEGRRIKVVIDIAFCCHITGFEGCIDAAYNRYGNVSSARKTAPPAYKGAAYTVNFGGGSQDSADWRGVFNCDALLTALEAL